MKHLIYIHTHLFGQNIFIRLISANENSPVGLLKLAMTENLRLIRDPTSFKKKLIVWMWVPETQINLKFPWLLILQVLHEIFCLLRDYGWGYFSQTGILMLHMNNQSWNYPWRSATQLFLAWTDHLSWRFLSIVTCLQTTQLKTNQDQPKSHANQLISDNLCSLPVACTHDIC